MLEELEQCKICPRECKVNRIGGKLGNCKASDKIDISLVSLHTYFIKISVIPINNKKEINNKRPKESNININKIVYRYN